MDALIAAPAHHTLLFEDADVRVLETRIRPGERTPVHTHRWPSVLSILSWSPFIRRDADGVTQLDTRGSTTAPPQALYSPPLGPHTLENVGDREIRVISVELKRTPA